MSYIWEQSMDATVSAADADIESPITNRTVGGTMKKTAVMLGCVAALGANVAAADIGIAARVSTLGYGAELSYGFSKYFSLGVTANAVDDEGTETIDNIDYNYNLDFSTYGALLHWHVFGGHFHITAGAFNNDNEVGVTAAPPAGTNIGGYTTTGGESLAGAVTFSGTAPYIGIGWGNRPEGSFGLTFDVGAVYQGSPSLSLSGSCGGAPGCNQATLDAAVATERQQAEEDLSDFKWWPVVSLGLYYRF
jgi:hypothetical protein